VELWAHTLLVAHRDEEEKLNVDISQVPPGTPGVTHGSGVAGELIRYATQSWAGHAVTYIGGGQIVEGTAPCTRIAPAASHDDTIWFYKMWDQLSIDVTGWWSPPPKGQLPDKQMIQAAQLKMVARAHALVGTPYDYMAYMGFAMEVLHLRNGTQMESEFKQDDWRVCSADVIDEMTFSGIHVDWNRVKLANVGDDPNLVSPSMLLQYATTLGWV